VAQRVYGLALGYEDLNDHDALRADSVLALLAGKRDLTGASRERSRDRGYPLAGSSTLNRLELGTRASAAADRYKRIVADPAALDRLLVDLFVESHEKPPKEIWLDLDATDDPLHGHQEGRFFHGYYRCSQRAPYALQLIKSNSHNQKSDFGRQGPEVQILSPRPKLSVYF
jgi:hypothetical protein